MLALFPVALLQLDKLFLHLFCVRLNIVKDSLVYGESLIYLSEALIEVFILVVDLVLEKPSVCVETS